MLELVLDDTRELIMTISNIMISAVLHSAFKERPFMAALRVGEYKIIWGSRTQKDTWFPALEEPVNKAMVYF